MIEIRVEIECNGIKDYVELPCDIDKLIKDLGVKTIDDISIISENSPIKLMNKYNFKDINKLIKKMADYNIDDLFYLLIHMMKDVNYENDELSAIEITDDIESFLYDIGDLKRIGEEISKGKYNPKHTWITWGWNGYLQTLSDLDARLHIEEYSNEIIDEYYKLFIKGN